MPERVSKEIGAAEAEVNNTINSKDNITEHSLSPPPPPPPPPNFSSSDYNHHITEDAILSSSSSPISTPIDQEISETQKEVANFVIEALRTAVATEHSVHTCAGSLQNQYAHNPKLVQLCLNAFVDFFLSVDNKTRITAFYILNDLVQYDPRFRLPVLQIVVPSIAWAVSMMNDKEIYLKTISVWEQRKVYPPEVCKSIEAAFHVSEIGKRNAAEYEQRLNSLVDMIRIRSAKDEDLERLFREPASTADLSDIVVDGKASTATTIMAASTTELRSMAIMSRAILSATQGTIEYLNRLLMDCESQYNSVNLKAMSDVLQILGRSNAPYNQPPA